MARLRVLAFVCAAVAAAAFVPGPRWSALLVAALVGATLAQAWNWLGGYGGIVSFGHAVFFGIGAYGVAVSNLRGGSPWYGALGGALAAALVGWVIGALTLRGRGWAFSAVMLAIGAAAAPLAARFAWVGPGNAMEFSHRLGFLNLQFSAAWPYALLALMVFAVTQGLTIVLADARPGLLLRAVRADEHAARGLGIAARPWRLGALAASAFVTSVAGSFAAEYALRVDPAVDFGLALSLDIALAGACAGTRSVWSAPAAGAAFALLAVAIPLHPGGAGGAAAAVAEAALAVAIVALRRRAEGGRRGTGRWSRRAVHAA